METRMQPSWVKVLRVPECLRAQRPPPPAWGRGRALSGGWGCTWPSPAPPSNFPMAGAGGGGPLCLSLRWGLGGHLPQPGSCTATTAWPSSGELAGAGSAPGGRSKPVQTPGQHQESREALNLAFCFPRFVWGRGLPLRSPGRDPKLQAVPSPAALESSQYTRRPHRGWRRPWRPTAPRAAPMPHLPITTPLHPRRPPALSRPPPPAPSQPEGPDAQVWKEHLFPPISWKTP